MGAASLCPDTALTLDHALFCWRSPDEIPARAWVLGCILGSAFLGDHPKPEALLMWIMSEYQELLPRGKSVLHDIVEHAFEIQTRNLKE